MENHYPYDKRFQAKILALIIRDQKFFNQVYTALHESYFEHDDSALIYRLVVAHRNKYDSSPTRSSLVSDIVDYGQRMKGTRDEECVLAKELLGRLFKMNLRDSELVREKVIAFGRKQAMSLAIEEAIDVIQEGGNLESIVKKVNDAFLVGADRDLGINYQKQFENMPALVEQYANNPEYKVPTGMKILDRVTKGGLGFGQIGLVVAPSGSGKSTFLVNRGVAAVRRGKAVVHVTLGDLNELDIMVKYAARFTKMKLDDVIGKPAEFVKRQLSKATRGNLFIKYYNPGMHTVGDIRAYIHQLEEEYGKKAGLLVIDYADHLVSQRKLDGTYLAMGEIYDSMISLGRDLKFPIWTGSQMKIEDQKAILANPNKLAGQSSVSDSKLKQEKAALVGIMCQSEAEARLNKIRFYLDKNRFGKDKFVINCKFNKPRGYIVEDKEANKNLFMAEDDD